jgi:Undecaprenyl-phosphate glucose phosphotransferase
MLDMAGSTSYEFPTSGDNWRASEAVHGAVPETDIQSFPENLMPLRARTDAGASRRHGRMLTCLLDIIAIALGAFIARHFEAAASQPGFDNALVVFALLVSLVLFPSLGLYRVSRGQVLWRCVCAPALAWITTLAVAWPLAIIVLDPYRPTGGWLLRWTLFSGLGLVVWRLAQRYFALRRADRGVRSCAVAIVGSGEHCRQLLRKVESTTDSRYVVSTVFDTGPQTEAAPYDLAAFRDRIAFAEYVRRHDIKELWLALPLSDEETILGFIELFRNDLVNIRFIPVVSGLALRRGDMVDLEGTSAINIVGSPFSPDALVAKDIFDRLFALLMVIVLAPLLLVIALAVKLTSPGPVFFTQRRKGANGEIFNIYKFRSMRVHETARGVVKQATRNDPRITRVGAFLRRTSLDELPQFFNVLRGEMSVVGPRPHAIEHDTLYQDIVDGYIHRYRIKPGISGWAQVNGFRGETDSIEKMEKRVEYDLYYLSNWSFALDMRIVLMTVAKGLVHRNAY